LRLVQDELEEVHEEVERLEEEGTEPPAT